MAWFSLLKLRNFLPYPIRSFLTTRYFAGQDFLDTILRKRIQGVPPKKLMVGGTRSSEDFVKHGNEFFSYMKGLCSLQPGEKILDVGCGIGQKMFPLLAYLDDRGGYEGFDLDPKRISWLSSNVTPAYAHFRFQACDIYNKHYNPRGLYDPAAYLFPYDDSSFDFVLCASLFTHMPAKDVAHYLTEIARVLRPGGRCLLTFFLLNAESRTCIERGKSSLDFCYDLDRCYTIDSRLPEAAIAFDEVILCELIRSSGLSIDGPIYFGDWCGREQALSYQDLVIAGKR